MRRVRIVAVLGIANPATGVRFPHAPPEAIIAAVAQLVERNLAKVEVESSRLFCRSKHKEGKRLKALSLFVFRGSRYNRAFRPDGEIGRHKGLKIPRRKPYRFDPGSGHQPVFRNFPPDDHF